MMDNRANMALEIAIVLVVILMIGAMVVNFSQNLNQKAVDASQRENTEILLSEVVDNLINNPGVPSDWYEYEKGTPGLAIVNEQGEVIPNSVSYVRFQTLNDNYKKLVDEKLFNSKVKTSLELVPYESSVSSVKIGKNNENGDVFSINRLVKCDFFKSFVIKDFQNDGKCNHGHDQKTHSCNYFKIFKGNLKKTDYYLIFDKHEKNEIEFTVDTTRIVKSRFWETPSSDKIYINDRINFYDDTSAVVFIHIDKPKAKAVLVGVPKSFNVDELNYNHFRTNDCNLIVKAWY